MTIRELDLAWERINALGGTVSPCDLGGMGFNRAVAAALDIIEQLGGSDPSPKRAARAKGMSK